MKNTVIRKEIRQYPKDGTIRTMELFFGMFSHEINAQLAGIKQCYECIQVGKSNSEVNMDFYLEAINSINSHALNMLNNLLTTVKFHAGKLDIRAEIETFKISTWIKAIIKPFEATNTEEVKNITLILRDTEVTTDNVKLAQILYNLLANARKYHYPGTPITVKCYRQGPMLVLQVINKGNGIPAGKIADLFKPYQQLENGYNGTGLGLFICDLYAKALGGSISVESKENASTIFTVHIPDHNFKES